MKIPASKVPAQVWADKARRRADLDEVESMLLSSWDDSKQVYRIGKELWDELRIESQKTRPWRPSLGRSLPVTRLAASRSMTAGRAITRWASTNVLHQSERHYGARCSAIFL